ncbi:MAG: Gfo/Idh/MocA family oxidoreductase [Prevotella sp.]|nr:Gfo/Idh/MocA family oxidoreductase [Prevotella sp.]
MVKIGMIGYNEGNGHPYSFSAIINGYNPSAMETSPYPIINKYLSERNKDEFGINDFKVTHIWTPNIFIAKNIAECTYIPNIVSDYRDFVGQVDAVIIARDDVDSHFELINFFLKEKLLVFVDKPLCSSLKHLDFFMPYIESAQLMSCSGLRYQPDIITFFDGKLKREDICFVNTLSLLDWKKYGIHLLEAITPIMGIDIKKVSNLNDKNNYIVKIEYYSGQYALIQINNNCINPMQAEFFTINESLKTIFNQNFVCFKTLLIEFSKMIKNKKAAINPMETYMIVKTIIEGEKYA